jgi:transposase
MRGRPGFPISTRLEVVKRYLDGESKAKLCREYGVNKESVRVWVEKFRKDSVTGLQSRKTNRPYSVEFKKSVVQEYNAGVGSMQELAIRHSIAGKTTLRVWIMKYNSGHGEGLKSYYGGNDHMTKGRKTTLEERVRIVEYCLEHERDYVLTSREFGVSYPQVYSLVRKHEARGVAGLKDTRGKGKAIEDMTELERLKAENRLLEAKNYRLQMENDLIKKVREIERGSGSALSDLKDSTKR